MKMKIPIRLVRTKKRVATMHFKGGRRQGVGRVIAEQGHREDAQKIRGIIAARRDLLRAEFVSEDKRVRGWRGFDGTLNALVISLGAIGMEVEPAAIVWPSKRGER